MQEPEPESPRVDVDAFYSKAFMQSEAGDCHAALKTMDGAFDVAPEGPDFLKPKAEVSLRADNL